MNWSLDALFKSTQDQAYTETFTRLEALVEDALKWVKNPPQVALDAVKKGVKISREFRTHFLKVGAFNNLTLATDTQNTDALKESQRAQMLAASMSPFSTAFENYVAQADLEALLKDSELAPFAYYLSRLKDASTYLLSSAEEQLLAEMSSTAGSAWSRLQGVLTSTLMIDINGTQKPLSDVRNMAFSKDKDLRKTAYEAELAAYEKIDEAVAASLNSIKGEVNLLTRKRGFTSPLSQATYQSRMEEATLHALMEAMKEHRPKFQAYLTRKGELLGHKNGLPWYDLFAPMGESQTTFTEAAALDYVEKQFRTFSSELADLARRSWDEKWIDFPPKKGKRGGAFCSNLHPINASRILLNFEGSFSNVITLAHELGHAYHGDQIFKEDILNASYTMPVAETASTLCETIVKKAAIEDAKGAEKIFLLEQSIMGSTQVIVDILSRFIFESTVFEERLKGPLSVERLKTIMTDAQKEAYGSALDKDALHPYMWINKPHYYSAGLSFYNFPYAFGLLFAKGIYAQYAAKGSSFVPSVNALLQKTGQMSVEDVALEIGIDVKDKAFWHESLNVIEAEIDLFLELTQTPSS